MKLWLIRHAIAVEADEFPGDDLERPLTTGGRRSAKTAFSQLAKLRRGPDVIIASEAVRAWETARILGLIFGINEIRRDARLNPGCRFKDIRKVVASMPSSVQIAALVGHEPDFSTAVSRWTAHGELVMAFKKGGLVELELSDDGEATLLSLVPPDLLGG